MSYEQVKETALSYADRVNDTELDSRFDDILRIAEANISRELRVMDMTSRVVTESTGSPYYAVPTGFQGIRSITVQGQDTIAMEYREPRSMSSLVERNYVQNGPQYYTILANTFHILPVIPEGLTIEIVFYQSLEPLCPGKSNWVSERHPDLYNSAVLQQVANFYRDADGVAYWLAETDRLIAQVHSADATDRWSGNPTKTVLDIPPP